MGRPTSGTDAKGQSTTFSYDSVGRLAAKTNAVGAVSFGWSEPRAGYHNVASLTSVNAPGVVQQLDYDALGRVVRQTRVVNGVPYVASKDYYEGGRVVGMSYPDGEAIAGIEYDEAGRLRAIPGFVNDVTYDALGRPLQQSNANGTQTSWTYSAERGFLERILTAGSSTLQDLSYTHDAAGLVTEVTSPHADESWSYSYDDLYRLTDATNSSNPAESQGLVYDEIGRLTYNSRVGTYAYPGAGAPRPHAPSSVNGSPFSYDANGNLTSGGGRTPVWDAENRITQIGSAQFSYDAFGERVRKTATGITSVYPFGDDYEITNGLVTKYVSVGGLGVVAKRVGGATYWLHTDRQGSIQALTDAAGAEVLRRTYRPYGGKIADSTGHAESRGWIDQRQDAETGLTYLHARYYDSELGLFMSPDPIGPAGGLNAFAYASGNPVNASDRSGLLEALEGNGRQIAITYGDDSASSATDDFMWRSIRVGGVGSGALFGLLRLITGESGDGPGPDSGPRSGLPGTGGYNTEGDGHERPTGGGRRDSDWTPGGGGRRDGGPSQGGPAPPDVPPAPTIPPGGTGGMPGDRQPSTPAGRTQPADTGSRSASPMERALGYVLHSTYTPARLVDSWFPEHDRNNWFDRALDSVSPQAELILGMVGSVSGPKLRFLHGESTLVAARLDYFRLQSTDQIVSSLRPGLRESLIVKADGTVMKRTSSTKNPAGSWLRYQFTAPGAILELEQKWQALNGLAPYEKAMYLALIMHHMTICAREPQSIDTHNVYLERINEIQHILSAELSRILSGESASFTAEALRQTLTQTARSDEIGEGIIRGINWAVERAHRLCRRCR